MGKLIKNEIIQHNELESQISKIAKFKGSASQMHLAKLLKRMGAEINENGMQEILFRDLQNGIIRVYKAKRNAFLKR